MWLCWLYQDADCITSISCLCSNQIALFSYCLIRIKRYFDVQVRDGIEHWKEFFLIYKSTKLSHIKYPNIGQHHQKHNLKNAYHRLKTEYLALLLYVPHKYVLIIYFLSHQTGALFLLQFQLEWNDPIWEKIWLLGILLFDSLSML